MMYVNVCRILCSAKIKPMMWDKYVIDQFDSDLELTEAEMHLYSRQILLDGWDIEAQEKLKLANVLIVGCGGIGCCSAELLARAGVGQITLIDADQIEMSNLQRQIAFRPEDIGDDKAEVLAQRLQQINPNIRVIAKVAQLDQDNAQQLIASQDLVLDGCDNFATRYLVNQSCKATKVALISASAIGFQGQLFMQDADSACYQCLFPQQADQADDLGLRCAETGVLATTPNVMASLQAHHALIYLGLGLSPLCGKLLLWDGLNMKQRILNFVKDDQCPVCLQNRL